MAIKFAAAIFIVAQSVFAQPPQPTIGQASYEVVSIKLEAPDPQANGFRYTPTGFEAYGVTLTDIVREAYGLPDPRLVKGASMVKPAYHIVAKFSEPDMEAMRSLPPATATQVRQRLLQAILKDRFQATVHHTSNQLPIYSLEVNKSGLKLQEIRPESANASQEKKGTFFAHGRIKGVFSMEQLARILSFSAKVGSDASDRRVFNNTGLKGLYMFDLAWTDASGQPPPDSKDVEIYSSASSALEQAGLRLVPKTIDADSVVVDHAATPSLD
jgi:uncharacterized protein (TIGR03435 family)